MATASKSPTMKLMKTPGKAVAAQVEQAEAEEDQAEAVSKTTTKSKVATKVKAPAAEPVNAVDTVEESDDLIVKTKNEIEHLKPEKAFKLVPTLMDTIDHDYFRLGGVLSAIQIQGWFMDKGHETFRSFVEAESGLAYRKAMYLINIYNCMVESGVAWDVVKHLGWSKLKELAPIITLENVDDWVAVAENLTVIQLQEHIKASSKGESASTSPEVDKEVSKTTTMTFKLHQDQKDTIREALDKAKHETGTEFDAVALEAMALDFLGGESKLKAIPSLKEYMAGKSAEEVLEAFGEVFPDVVLEATLP